MKRLISLLLVCVLIAFMVGCDGDSDKATGSSDYTPDYYDAETFECDLNAGVNVNGKIVQFYVNDYKPDSILGINTWAGEHLNFISEDELDVEVGDYIIGKVTSAPTKTLLGGSWKIPYEVLEIRDTPLEKSPAIDVEIEDNSEATEGTKNTQPTETTVLETTVPETTIPEKITITMPAGADTYIGKTQQEVGQMINNLGFGNIKKVESKTPDASKTDGTVASITIDSVVFAEGDSFEKTAEVVIIYWKVEKPISEYELAFVRKLSGYSLYYMFDTDTKKVVQFGTDDTYLYRGTYTGNFSSGVTMTWDHGEWTDKFKYSEGSSKATYYDGYGYDWEYTVCDLKTAQELLDSREK